MNHQNKLSAAPADERRGRGANLCQYNLAVVIRTSFPIAFLGKANGVVDGTLALVCIISMGEEDGLKKFAQWLLCSGCHRNPKAEWVR